MDIQILHDFLISKNTVKDIQKCIYGYRKNELWISKNRFLDILKLIIDIQYLF